MTAALVIVAPDSFKVVRLSHGVAAVAAPSSRKVKVPIMVSPYRMTSNSQEILE
jgi:hypothetical protein